VQEYLIAAGRDRLDLCFVAADVGQAVNHVRDVGEIH
jgi:hypothetical protein